MRRGRGTRLPFDRKSPGADTVVSAIELQRCSPCRSEAACHRHGTGGRASQRTWLVVVQVSALNIKYEQTDLTAPAGTPFQVSFENKDAGVPHNVTLHQGDANGAELFKGEIFNGVATRVYDVPALDAGSYAFVCSVHPTMIGTLTVK